MTGVLSVRGSGLGSEVALSCILTVYNSRYTLWGGEKGGGWPDLDVVCALGVKGGWSERQRRRMFRADAGREMGRLTLLPFRDVDKGE